jgi:isopropylmalate/homocitrate/citramalate synthase
VSRAGLPRRVTIVEVGPRDGLQNEAAAISTAAKIAFADALAAAGLPVIEVAAFVNPERVPQMADAADVVRGLTRREGVRYTALVPNRRGLAAARAAGLTEVAIFAAASETFSRRNINQSVDASLVTYGEVIADARAAGIRVRGYVSTAFGCPFEGPVAASRVVDLAVRLLELGIFEVAVSDTIGVATPHQVLDLLDALVARVPLASIALHLHDTRGTALANVYAALEAGVSTFDASAGGLGGCPFAPGAAGNLATEDLLFMLDGLGIETGVDIDAVRAASLDIARALNHPLASRYVAAGPPRR